MYECMYAFMHVCMYVCMHGEIFIYIYIFTYKFLVDRPLPNKHYSSPMSGLRGNLQGLPQIWMLLKSISHKIHPPKCQKKTMFSAEMHIWVVNGLPKHPAG